jgi:hypothetical protein
MATKIGRNAKVAISDDGITYVDIGKVTSASMSFASDMADETNNDSGGFKDEQPADSQAVIELSGKADVTDTGQVALSDCAFLKTKKYFRFRSHTNPGDPEFVFQGHASDFSNDTETGAVEDLSATITSSGTVTKQAQT